MSEKPPMCIECDAEMCRYGPALDTGKMGYRCDSCGWSWDDDDEDFMEDTPVPNDNTHTLLPCPFCGADPITWTETISGASTTYAICESDKCREDHTVDSWNTRTPAEPKAGDWEKELDSYQQRVMCDPLYGYIGRDELIRQTFGYTRAILRRALSSAAPRITEDNERATVADLIAMLSKQMQLQTNLVGQYQMIEMAGKAGQTEEARRIKEEAELTTRHINDIADAIQHGRKCPPPFTPTQTEE